MMQPAMKLVFETFQLLSDFFPLNRNPINCNLLIVELFFVTCSAQKRAQARAKHHSVGHLS